MALLETRNLSKSFGGLQAINDVSLKVEPNTVHGLIGPNGSGKSTFFNLLTGVYQPDAGSYIEFNNTRNSLYTIVINFCRHVGLDLIFFQVVLLSFSIVFLFLSLSKLNNYLSTLFILFIESINTSSCAQV